MGAVAEQVRQAQEKFPITVECDEGPVLWTCWQSSDGKMLIYCLNPDDRSARSNVVITANVKAHSASFHSPDSATKLDSIESRGEDVMCTIRTLDVFGYLELTIPC